LLEIAADGLTAHPIGRISFAGEFRRGCELVADLGLAAERTAPAKGTQIQKTANGCAIYLSGPQSFGSALLFATGSKAHLQELVTIAAKKQMELKPDGLYRTGKALPSSTEEEIYNALGLPFIPPELREGADENKLGRRGRLPDLVCEADIKGILHAHTDASDGVASLKEMARAVQEGGYAYFGVTDHSQSAHYAGGLKVDEIAAQHAAIDALNGSAGAGFRIFKGIEADILPDGSLDYPDDILARFDFVIASVHSRFQLDRKSQTERILKAVANPYTTILGHMTGRQLLRRQGYDIDIDRVLQACASHGVAVEINGNPIRLDLDWRWHRRAMDSGCLFSINPDAHSIAEIGLVRWGVKVARKGAVPAERVLNALSLREFGNYLDRRRRSFR
jgi:DNA polymerase (family X)